jgi:hypothetical protein
MAVPSLVPRELLGKMQLPKREEGWGRVGKSGTTIRGWTRFERESECKLPSDCSLYGCTQQGRPPQSLKPPSTALTELHPHKPLLRPPE